MIRRKTTTPIKRSFGPVIILVAIPDLRESCSRFVSGKCWELLAQMKSRIFSFHAGITPGMTYEVMISLLYAGIPPGMTYEVTYRPTPCGYHPRNDACHHKK